MAHQVCDITYVYMMSHKHLIGINNLFMACHLHYMLRGLVVTFTLNGKDTVLQTRYIGLIKGKKMKLKSLLVLFLVFVTAGLAQAGEPLVVSDAWVREAPPGAPALAGYMQLHNKGDKDRMLVGAACPAFESVMLHKTIMEGDVSKMVHQRMITIPAKGMVSFEPNSYHLMMMKPKQALKAGDKVTVTLSFKNGETQEVSYTVRAGAGMGGMNHGSGQGMNMDMDMGHKQ